MLDTLENVKTRLGVTTSSDDTFLTGQIALISDVIEAYCRRKFASTSWVQKFYREDLNNYKFLDLFHFPLISLESLSIDEVELEEEQLRIHKPTGQVKRVDGGRLYGEEIIVEYTAGYAAIPTPILAVLDALVGERYNKKKSGVDLNFGSDVQRISIPGAISIDFDYSLANNERKSSYGTIIGSYSNVLDDWRSERAVIGSGKVEYVEVAEVVEEEP